jgi:hypothetical protein
VAHTCNPSYSGGRDQEDLHLKPGQANSLCEPILKKTNKKGLVEWLKALSSSPRTTNKTKQNNHHQQQNIRIITHFFFFLFFGGAGDQIQALPVLNTSMQSIAELHPKP